MLLFNIYTLIGGMPEVVQLYAERRDILSLESTYETLLQGYRDDVGKICFGKTTSGSDSLYIKKKDGIKLDKLVTLRRICWFVL